MTDTADAAPDVDPEDRAMVRALLAKLGADRPSDLTGEDSKRFHKALALHLGLTPDDIVLVGPDEDGRYRPELREDVLKDREALAAADCLLTRFCLRHTDLSAGEIEDLSVTEKIEQVQAARDANAAGGDA